MGLILLIAVITTSQNYTRGFGDGIAASKSASAAIHMERFLSRSSCEQAKTAFLKIAGEGAKASCVILPRK